VNKKIVLNDVHELGSNQRSTISISRDQFQRY